MRILRRSRQIWRLVGPAAAFVAVSAAALVLLLQQGRDATIRAAETRIEELAAVLADQAADAVHTVDVSLQDVVKLAAADDEDALLRRVTTQTFHNLLVAQNKAVPNVNDLGIADSVGDVVAATIQTPLPPGYNIADRPYFRDLSAKSGEAMYISEVLIGKISKRPMLVFARRLEGRDGQFLGIVYYSIETTSLLRPHPSIAGGAGIALALATADGVFLSREPAAPGAIGSRIPAGSPWWAASRAGGLFHVNIYFDHVARHDAVRPVAGYPFVATVAIDDDAILADWRRRAAAASALGVITILLACALIVGREVLKAKVVAAVLRAKLRGGRLTTQQAELRKVNERFADTLDRMEIGLAVVDERWRVIIANRHYAELFGMRPEQVRPGMAIVDVIEQRIAAKVYSRETAERLRANYGQFELWGERIDRLTDGRVISVQVQRTREGGFCTINKDITAKIVEREKLSAMALSDNLTGLGNRNAFGRHMAALAAAPSAASAAMLLIDIDGFKDVNDTHGHAVGDAVLVEIARRICAAFPGAFVARLGGDEFVVVDAMDRFADDPLVEAEKLIAEIRKPVHVDGRAIAVGACVGVEPFDPAAISMEQALRRADLALYEAKRLGRNVARPYVSQLEQRFLDRSALAHELRGAIERREIDVHYQPIVNAFDRRVISMEALARWTHRERGPISPADFVPLAEETGDVIALDELVMRRACADAVAWPEDVILSINVSSIEVSQADFVDRITSVLRETGLPPARLEIEITETALLRNEETTRDAMVRLRKLGVSFSLDDFGSGFASLAYLKAFKFDHLKIDRAYVADICENPQSASIVAAIVALARGLDIASVTAEGVETPQQLAFLTSAGVTTVQGYLLGRPAPNPNWGREGRSVERVRASA